MLMCILRRTFDEEFNLIQHDLRILLRKRDMKFFSGENDKFRTNIHFCNPLK